MTERDIFLALLDIPDPDARATFLAQACAEDATLRRRVESLLRSHAIAGNFLDKPAVPSEHLEDTETQELGVESLSDERAAADQCDLSFLAASAQPDSLGRLGHYEILEVLGRGGFGIVFRAFDETLHRPVAIKVLAPQLAATSPARKRFLREARSSARVRHANVVQVYAVQEQPLPYLVMEFVPGETLQQRFDRTGPLEVPEIVRLGRQIAQGLAAAHDTGLIHRDVKPGNILIEAGPEPHVKITDFGLARAADDASLSQSGIVAGTPMYMAPEQASAEPLDHRADLFSLGSVLYAMCTGRPPFRARTTLAVLKRVAEDTPRPIREIVPEVPEWLCDLIARLHAKKPEDRFASAHEVADLLAQHLAPPPHPGSVPAPPIAAPPGPERTPQETPPAVPARRPRFRTRWAVAAAALLLLLGGLGFTEATGVTDVHGTVIRLFFPEGTLVVEVDDPKVSVKIEGSDLVITGAGTREIRLRPGSYTVEASKDGKVVRQELVTVTTNGRRVVRVSVIERQGPPKLAPKVSDPMQAPDRRAAEYVLSIGGAVKVSGQVQEIKAVADLPQKSFQLTKVELRRNKQVADADLALFIPCKKLTQLSLWQTNVGDEGLVHVKECKAVTHLWLGTTPVTDAGLAHLDGRTNLVLIDLLDTRVTDVGLAHLKGCRGLRSLSVSHTGVTDAGFAHLAGFKNLTELFLDHTQVGDAGLDHLKGAPLNMLYFNQTAITDLSPLQGMPLKYIRLTPKNITRGLEILRDMKSLITIGIDYNQRWPAAEFWERHDRGEFKE